MFALDGSHWLTPGEQWKMMRELVRADGVIVSDNARKLPLSNGGVTDIYCNIRLLRMYPATSRYVAEAFAITLRRLQFDKIVEVPQGITPLAGHISAIADIPLVTIREETKAGRVTKGRMIGRVGYGDRVAIIDDVITDGASKLPAIRELRAAGAIVVAIVVLVDRQQGWRKVLADAGYGDVPVWAAFTLHDQRRFLIDEGLLQRCDPAMEAKNPLIIALDGKPWEEVLPIIDRLRPTGCILKANDLLATDGINRVIERLSVYGRVMADPKWCDIPPTVANFCRRLRATPPWAVTIHASGGSEMIKAAVDTLRGTPTMVLAVTVLTSIEQECELIYGEQPWDKVSQLAAMAYAAGARGFVCSAQEVAGLRAQHPDVTLVVPGLRSPGADRHEQKRVASFAEAKRDGANFFVGGRQFLTAADPIAEIGRVLADELLIK